MLAAHLRWERTSRIHATAEEFPRQWCSAAPCVRVSDDLPTKIESQGGGKGSSSSAGEDLALSAPKSHATTLNLRSSKRHLLKGRS